jgi:ribosomal protein L21
VVATVEEHFKDAKVLVFKKKKRKRYSRLQGHR